MSANTGHEADVTAKTSWSTYEAAVKAKEEFNWAGVGLCVTQQDPYVAADLDHCRDPSTGVVEPWAQEIVDSLGSFTEVTPSNCGLRVWIKGGKPGPKSRKGNVEVYDHDRFFTVTGNHLTGTPTTIEERQEGLNWLYGKFLEPPAVPPASTAPPPTTSELSDDQIIEKLTSANDGGKGQRLWEGDATGYDSASEADAALCSKLGFYTGADPDRIERLFDQSGLVREKWTNRPECRQSTIALSLQAGAFYDSSRNGAASGSLDGNPADGEWPVIVGFINAVGPPFPLDALPDAVRRFVEASASSFQVPADLPALLVLGAGHTAAAKRSVVRLGPDWQEPLADWYMNVLPSGERRTPSYKTAIRPIEDRERELAEAARPEIAEQKAKHDVLEQRLANAKRDAAKGNVDTEDVVKLAKELADTRVLTTPRLLAGDATPEAITGLLADHDGRMAVWADEGGLFDNIGGRYNDGISNLDAFLDAYSASPIRVDRRSRPPEFIPSPALTLVLTVQPNVLAGLADNPRFRGRGLLARFSYSIPQSRVGTRDVDAPPIPEDLVRGWDRLIRNLLKLPTSPDGKPPEITLSTEAKALFRAYRFQSEQELGPGGRLHDLQDWGLKRDGKVARVAGVLHLFTHHDKPDPWDVPLAESTMQSAMTIVDYFVDHALVAFAMMGADPAIEDAKHVARWIERERCSLFTKQGVWQATKSRFRRVVGLNAALDVLEERGIVRRQEEERVGRGRPAAPSYEVNPDFLRHRKPVDDPPKELETADLFAADEVRL